MTVHLFILLYRIYDIINVNEMKTVYLPWDVPEFIILKKEILCGKVSKPKYYLQFSLSRW